MPSLLWKSLVQQQQLYQASIYEFYVSVSNKTPTIFILDIDDVIDP